MRNIQIDIFNNNKQWHMSFTIDDSECRAWGTCDPFAITYMEDGCGLDILETCEDALAQEILSHVKDTIQMASECAIEDSYEPEPGDREPFFPPSL